MRQYSYRCEVCQSTFTKRLGVEDCTKSQLCECGRECDRVVGKIAFLQRGDGWFGKNMTIKRQMESKNKRLDAIGKQKLREAPPMTLAPNVNGERVDSWAEAKKLATSKGLRSSSYDSKVLKERNDS